MATAQQFGVLLVTGAQTHQENYAEAFAADRRCRLVALTDEPTVPRKRLELNRRLARALGIPYISDLAEALRRPDVDLVSICAEPPRRARIAVQAAQAGKHLYLDKSLAPDLAQADAIVQAVARAGVRSHMFSFITQPWVRRAKALVDSGRLGQLAAIHADTQFAKGRPGSARLGRPRREHFPPNPQSFQTTDAKREMDNVGVYPLATIGWLTGWQFQSVYAVTANYFFQEHQRRDVEDFAVMTLGLSAGRVATVSAGRCGWTSHPAGGVNRLLLVGTKASAMVDPYRPRLEICDDQPPWTPPPVNPQDPMGFWQSTQQEVHTLPKTAWQPLSEPASDASYFLDCLEQGRDSQMSADRAALVTEVLTAAYKSAATGAVVRLPLPR